MGTERMTFNWRAEFLHALMELTELPDDSDNWKPHRPSSEMIMLAHKLADSIHKDVPLPMIAAGTDGTIQIKWQKPDLEASIFVYRDGTLEYLSLSSQDRKSGDFQLSEINDLLSDF
jgi:hypothetical protein